MDTFSIHKDFVYVKIIKYSFRLSVFPPVLQELS
jgi:hypothetical protein